MTATALRFVRHLFYPFLLLVAEGAELFVFAVHEGVHSACLIGCQGGVKQDERRRRGQLPTFVESTVDALVARLVRVAVAVNTHVVVAIHFAGINLHRLSPCRTVRRESLIPHFPSPCKVLFLVVSRGRSLARPLFFVPPF